jgi:predicted phosphoadenosine phosphosulfate sulfurtransferase
MCISFNGGKDCTVALHMIRLALPTTFRKVRLLYFRAPDEFEEIVTFVHQLVEEYQLTLHEYVSMPIKQGLQEFLAQVHPRRSKRQDSILTQSRFPPHVLLLGCLYFWTHAVPNEMHFNGYTPWRSMVQLFESNQLHRCGTCLCDDFVHWLN